MSWEQYACLLILKTEEAEMGNLSLLLFFILQKITSKSICKNNSLLQDGEVVAEIFKENHTAKSQDYLQ